MVNTSLTGLIPRRTREQTRSRCRPAGLKSEALPAFVRYTVPSDSILPNIGPFKRSMMICRRMPESRGEGYLPYPSYERFGRSIRMGLWAILTSDSGTGILSRGFSCFCVSFVGDKINLPLFLKSATTGLKDGGQGHNGGVWEWTSTICGKYEGYVPSTLYPG